MKEIIYQMLPRYWGNADAAPQKGASLAVNGCGRFDDIDKDSLDYLKWLGCSYIWYTGAIAHAMAPVPAGDLKAMACSPQLRKRFALAAADAHDGRPAADFVKGLAGSPYAISNYYDVAPYLGTLASFRSLVKRTHRAGLKCLVDFIPNHVAANYADHCGGIPDCGRCDYDWTDTVKIDYSDRSSWFKMLDIVRFWASQGVDGFRCDMVELVPHDFLKWLIENVKRDYPSLLFVAEVYDRNNYRRFIDEIGFDLLYDKSGLYDRLHALVCRECAMEANDPVSSSASARQISWNWQSLGDMQGKMLNFLENHDEKRIAGPAFAGKASRALAALAVSAAFNDGAFMIYEGQEVGERGLDDAGFSGADGRSTIYDWWTPEWSRKLNAIVHTKSYLSLSINEIVTQSNNCVSVREAELFCRYAVLLRSLAYGCCAEGQNSGCTDDRSYDLCWCQDSGEFDAERFFAFLRGNRLYVCNFSGRKRSPHIAIPQSAGEFYGCSFPKEIFITVPAFDFSVKELSVQA